MPLVFKYHSPGDEDEEPGYVDLGDDVVRWGELSLSQMAQTGEVAQSGIELDDPYGALDIVGLRAFSVFESSAASNNQQVWTGRISERTVRRMGSWGSNAVSRRWSLDLMDANWYLGNRILVDADAKRPDETGGDRLRWLLRYADHVYLHDFGHVDYPTNNMDDNDYRGQTAKDVLADIAAATGYNFWLDIHEASRKQELFFQKPSSTEYASTIRISNDFADVDGVTTFAPNMDAELRRSPDKIAFGVYVPFAKGSVYVRDQATGAAFAKVDKPAPNSNIKKRATAVNYGTRFLNDNDEEEDRISCWIIVPEAQVNDLRAGHLTSVKFTHFPGYEDFVLVRVLNRTITQDPEYAGSGYYRLDLELSPPGVTPVACSTSLLDVTASVVEEQSYVAPGTFSHSITPPEGYDYILIAGVQASNHNVPVDTNLTVTTSGWTEMYEANVSVGSPDTLAAYKAVSGASGSYACAGTYTPGYDPVNDSHWGVALAAFRTSATSPVQEKHALPFGTAYATLDSSPTEGNMLVLIVGWRSLDQATFGPSSWVGGSFSHLATAESTGPGDLGCVSIYARCVADGDGTSYGITGNSKYSFVSLSEWAIE